MKLATGLIALFLGLVILLQSCAVATTAHLMDARDVHAAGSVGVLVGFLFFLSGAFAFALPAVSTIMLAAAGLFGLLASGDFKDLGIWAWFAFALAAMAGWAWRSQRRAAAAAKAGVHPLPQANWDVAPMPGRPPASARVEPSMAQAPPASRAAVNPTHQGEEDLWR